MQPFVSLFPSAPHCAHSRTPCVCVCVCCADTEERRQERGAYWTTATRCSYVEGVEASCKLLPVHSSCGSAPLHREQRAGSDLVRTPYQARRQSQLPAAEL